MMISIALNDNNTLDLKPANRDRLTWLNNAITISLFTDARASDDDTLPDDGTDKRGYWGDMDLDAGESLGSKLWLLKRSKITQDTLNLMHDYIVNALQWLIDDGHLQSVQVQVERDTQTNPSGDVGRVNFNLQCQLPDGEQVTLFRKYEVQN